MAEKSLSNLLLESKPVYTRSCYETINTLKQKHKQADDYLRWLLPSVFQYFNENLWWNKIQWYKNYILYNADRKNALLEEWMEWRTNFKSPLTRTLTDTVFNRMFNNKFVIEVYTEKADNLKKDKDWVSWKDSVQAFNEWAYATADVMDNVRKALKDWIQTWDWFLRWDIYYDPDYWKSAAEKVKEIIKNRNWKKDSKEYAEITSGKAKAVCEYIPFEEIVYEAKKDFYDSNFVAWRKVQSWDKFYNRWQHLLKDELSEQMVKDLKSNNNINCYFNYNYSSFRRLKSIEEKLIKYSVWSTPYFLEENDLYKMNFWYWDPNFEWESVEFWTNDTLTLCRNGTVIYDWPNPLGIWNHPFVHFSMWLNPNGWINIWITQLLSWIQELYDLVYNWYSDFLKRHFNPMFMVTWSQWIEWFDEWFLKWEWYKIVKNQWEWKIERVNVWDDVVNWFQMLSSLSELASQMCNINRYTWSMSPGGWIERSPSAADYQVQITEDFSKPIQDQVSRSVNKISLIWTKLAKQKLPETFQVAILWKDWNEEFKKISTLDIDNWYVIKFRSDALNEYYKNRDKEKIVNLLQYYWSLLLDPATKEPIFNLRKVADRVAEIFELWDAVYTEDEAKKIIEEALAKQQQMFPQPQENYNNAPQEQQDVYPEQQQLENEETNTNIIPDDYSDI